MENLLLAGHVRCSDSAEVVHAENLVVHQKENRCGWEAQGEGGGKGGIGGHSFNSLVNRGSTLLLK